MGFFDRFRQSAPAYTMPDIAVAADSASMRPQHYYYAHRMLPTLAFEDPARMLAALLAPDAAAFLRRLWEAGEEAATHAGAQPGPPFVPPRPIHEVVDGNQSFVLALPQPLHSPEAFLVGLTFSPGAEPGQWQVRYKTLELTTDEERVTTVLCAWTAEGTHVNSGILDCPPEPKAFLEACRGVR